MAKKSAPPASTYAAAKKADPASVVRPSERRATPPALTPAQQRQAAENARVRNAPVNQPRAANPVESARTVGGAVKNLLGLGAISKVVDSASKKR